MVCMADRESEHNRKSLECGRERERIFPRQRKIDCSSGLKLRLSCGGGNRLLRFQLRRHRLLHC